MGGCKIIINFGKLLKNKLLIIPQKTKINDILFQYKFMVNLKKMLDDFRKSLSEKPSKAFLTIIGSFICILIIIYLKDFLHAFISSDLFYPILDFMYFMIIYAFYAFYFIPFVLHLPDGKQSFPNYLKSLKLTKNGFSFKKFFMGLIIGALVLIAYYVIDIILGEHFIFKLDINQIFQPPRSSNYGYFNFIIHLVPAFWEEIIFRGIIITILLKVYSIRMTIIIDGLFFGLVHVANHDNIFLGIGQGIYTCCSGIILAYLYIKTSNLIPSMIAHYVNNILSILISTGEVNALVFLFQQSLLSFIVLILGLGMIKLYDYLNYHLINKNSLNRDLMTLFI